MSPDALAGTWSGLFKCGVCPSDQLRTVAGRAKVQHRLPTTGSHVLKSGSEPTASQEVLASQA